VCPGARAPVQSRAFHDCVDGKVNPDGSSCSLQAFPLLTANAVAACSRRLQPAVSRTMESPPRMRWQRG
jgi:hypothetical protein